MEIKNLSKLVTEGRNETTMDIDNVSTLKIIELINEEDKLKLTKK